MNSPNGRPNANATLHQRLLESSQPLNASIRVEGSPRAPNTGVRKAIIKVNILNKDDGIHAYLYGFRRLEEPDKGTYVEKIHRDQVRRKDAYLLSPPLNCLRTTWGTYENGEALLNEKGYELSTFAALQNFQGKSPAEVRQLAKMFAMAIKHHIETDPNCQRQEVVVDDANIYYDEDTVFMDIIGERNAVNLYRSILPVDSTPGYSSDNLTHATSFFRQGSLSPESVTFIQGDDSFLAPEYRNEQQENNAQNGHAEEDEMERVD